MRHPASLLRFVLRPSSFCLHRMLRELHISNLAVIADARIELHARAELLHRGDRGGQVAGDRRGRGAARPAQPGGDAPRGRRRGPRVRRVRSARRRRRRSEIERVTDIPVVAEGGELLLTRRLYASGRSSVSLNGNPITLGHAQAGGGPADPGSTIRPEFAPAKVVIARSICSTSADCGPHDAHAQLLAYSID